jgi:hypothetical protein
MILTTFLSFMMYRRANKQPVVPWHRTGTMVQGALFAACALIVMFYGVYGYFVEAIVRIGFSVYQVLAVLACIVGVTVIDVFLGRGAESRGAIRWGQMPERSASEFLTASPAAAKRAAGVMRAPPRGRGGSRSAGRTARSRRRGSSR